MESRDEDTPADATGKSRWRWRARGPRGISAAADERYYAGLGKRVEKILRLAETQAAELIDTAEREATAIIAEAEQDAARIRAEAEAAATKAAAQAAPDGQPRSSA